MARWKPGTVDRLRRSALELFITQGFDQTTAAQIAEAAGLTQRTFFRYFGDKRDVLFHGQDEYVETFLDGMDREPTGASPLHLVTAAVTAAAELFPAERRPYSQMRQAVIDQHPALQERERHKSAMLAERLAAALRQRGVAEPAATLAAESGATVFGVAFGLWLTDEPGGSMPVIVNEVLSELRGFAAAL